MEAPCHVLPGLHIGCVHAAYQEDEQERASDKKQNPDLGRPLSVCMILGVKQIPDQQAAANDHHQNSAVHRRIEQKIGPEQKRAIGVRRELERFQQLRLLPEMLRHDDGGQENQGRGEAAKEGGKAAHGLFQRLPDGAVPLGLLLRGIFDCLHPGL